MKSVSLQRERRRALRRQKRTQFRIYTWRTCPFCIRAKRLLDSKGVDYTEYAIDGDNAARDAMAERSGGRRSVPEIFIDDQHIGGCDELHALDGAGDLDPLLSA